MILGDGMIGQMMEPVELVEPQKRELPAKDWATTGWDGKSRPRAVINSLFIKTEELEAQNIKLQAKYKEVEQNETRWEEFNCENAEFIVCAYGTVGRIVKNAVMILKEKGVDVGLIRPITVWPFPKAPLQAAANDPKVKAFLVVEMSAGQMVEDVRLAVNGAKPVEFLGKLGSVVPTPEEIVDLLLKMKGRE